MLLSTITCEMLKYRLDNDPPQSILRSYFAQPAFFLVADPATSESDWAAKSFGAFVSDKILNLFLSRRAAEYQAEDVQSVLPDGTFMVLEVGRDMVLALLDTYTGQDLVKKVRLQAAPPISATFDVQDVLKLNNQEDQDPVSDVPSECAVGFQVPEGHLAEKVRSVLDMPTAVDRRKGDPSDCYTNIHRLVEALLRDAKITPDQMDKELELQQGFTKNFCASVQSDVTPLEIVKKYLSHFGLFPYLYIFKTHCCELKDKLNADSQIDQHVVKKATVHTVERFQLENIVRGRDKEGCFVFRATFKSKYREVITILSSNHEMIVGKEYEIEGFAHDEPKDEASRGATSTEKQVLTSDEENADILRRIEEKEAKKKNGPPQQAVNPDQAERDNRMRGKNRYISETPSEKLERETNEVLAYLIKTNGCNSKDARRMIVPFDDMPDIVESFARYIKTGKAGPLTERNYTPKKLMSELHYSPYESFCMMAELRRNPKDTMQRLKYRATDPQYQTTTPA